LQADVLIVLVALITVTSLSLSVVPPGAAEPLRLGSLGGSGAGTVEGTFVGSPREMGISGSIDLSPEVRFTVEADEQRYWRTGAYDKYAGGQWFRRGESSPYDGRLDAPPGPRETVVQTYTVESEVKVMPAAAEPIEVVGGATANTLVTQKDTLKPQNKFIEGDRYRVRSEVPNATPAQLRNASTEYDSEINTEFYTQLPESTSSRFREVTREVTADAENPYETAAAIEAYLEANKEYSLDIEKPSGNVANNFLLNMDSGYCTYFATTMAAMLRTQDVPARIAVGYTPGQQVDDGEWVVRGLNSHVWVEVYFPEYGWVQFDPTPSGPRTDAETDRIQEARDSDEGGNVDTGDSEDVPVTPTATATPTANGTPTMPPNETIVPPGADRTIPEGLRTNPGGAPGAGGGPGTDGGSDGSDGSGGLPPLPSGRDTIVGAVLLLGVAAGAHRAGVPDRAYRAARLRWQSASDDAIGDVERAYERLETLLGRQYRPRRSGETQREYVAALADQDLDERARRVAEIHERAHYAGDVDRETADEAIALVDAMVRERTPVVGWVRRARR
jgi:transglutaminase-like putative cysteine protease